MSHPTPSSCFCRYASTSGPPARVCGRELVLSARMLARRGIITPIGKKRYAAVAYVTWRYTLIYAACLPRWLVSCRQVCMHCGPGLMSCCALHVSVETRRLKRGFGLCVRVCVLGVPLVCVCRICCVTCRYIHQVRVRQLLLVGRGDLETKTKRSACMCTRVSVQ